MNEIEQISGFSATMDGLCSATGFTGMSAESQVSFDGFLFHYPSPEDVGRLYRDIQYSGTPSPWRFSSVQDKIHDIAHGGKDFPGAHAGRLSRQVGTGSRNRPAQGSGQACCDGMTGKAYPNFPCVRRELRRNFLRRFEDQCEPSGPKGLHEPLGLRRDSSDDPIYLLHVWDKNQDGIVRASSFSLQKAVNCFLISSVHCKAVEGLRGEGDQVSGTK